MHEATALNKCLSLKFKENYVVFSNHYYNSGLVYSWNAK